MTTFPLFSEPVGAGRVPDAATVVRRDRVHDDPSLSFQGRDRSSPADPTGAVSHQPVLIPPSPLRFIRNELALLAMKVGELQEHCF